MPDQPAHFIREIEPGRFRAKCPLAVNAKDGSILVLVPGGTFEMGDGKDDDCPKHRVELSAYWIGVSAVTNAQYARFVSETGHRAPGNSFWRDAGTTRCPVTDVSWEDASAYTAWAGCGLPTEAQWEHAARGPANLLYPWGDEWDGSKCRHSGNRGSATTAAVWDYPSGVSGYGLYQASGNVWEWCADWYDSGAYRTAAARDPSGPAGGLGRVRRGGSWGGGVPSRFRGAYRRRSTPGFRYGYLGFRLARPAS